MMNHETIQALQAPALIVTCAAGREGEARRELRKILGDIDARPLYMKGNLLVEVGVGTTDEVLAAIRSAETATIARCVPVTVKASIGPAVEHLQTLYHAALRLVDFAEGETFRVACKRRGDHDFSSQDVQREIGLHLEKHTPAAFAFDEPDYVLFAEIYQDIAFLGCVPRDRVLVKTITKMRKYAPGKRPLNRAEAKLREALAAFPVTVDRTTRALDLGAAPGGWTKVLAAQGAQVVAVDPAELAPEVAGLPNVTHFRGRAEEYLEGCPSAAFDLITNDINRDPVESAELVRSLLPLLAPDGAVITTVKFMTSNRRKHIRDVAGILRPHFEEFRQKYLPHNARETTLFLAGRLPAGETREASEGEPA